MGIFKVSASKQKKNAKIRKAAAKCLKQRLKMESNGVIIRWKRVLRSELHHNRNVMNEVNCAREWVSGPHCKNTPLFSDIFPHVRCLYVHGKGSGYQTRSGYDSGNHFQIGLNGLKNGQMTILFVCILVLNWKN